MGDTREPDPSADTSDSTQTLHDTFSTDHADRIEAILDFIEDEENPATLGEFLAYLREDDDAELDESAVRERARERGLIQID